MSMGQSHESSIHSKLTALMSASSYGKVLFKDGRTLLYMPTSISQRADEAGCMTWVSSGLGSDGSSSTEQFAYLRLDAVQDIVVLPKQPTFDE